MFADLLLSSTRWSNKHKLHCVYFWWSQRKKLHGLFLSAHTFAQNPFNSLLVHVRIQLVGITLLIEDLFISYNVVSFGDCAYPVSNSTVPDIIWNNILASRQYFAFRIFRTQAFKKNSFSWNEDCLCKNSVSIDGYEIVFLTAVCIKYTACTVGICSLLCGAC